ncbi:hypothetical protein [Microbispora rosea]|uniref:hypothetical protein n=1 Tax=Microbispora rosea TaxID=58117 RepID=UPI003D9195BE
MNPTTAALLGALIGAVTALASAAFTSLATLYNERKKREDAERAAFVQSLRSTSATAFAEIYNFSHAMAWITSYARFDPEALDSDMVRSYERETHQTVPKLQGSLAVVASLSLTVYEQLQPLVHRLFVLDKHVSIAIGEFRKDRAAAVGALSNLIDDVNKVQDRLPPELNRIMQLAQSMQLNHPDPTQVRARNLKT